jgi:molecular chaperone DnaK (HSP70)
VDLPPLLMTSFFAPLFEKIKAKVADLMDQAIGKGAPINFIFMVGGFSESPFLKAEIKKTFENAQE